MRTRIGQNTKWTDGCGNTSFKKRNGLLVGNLRPLWLMPGRTLVLRLHREMKDVSGNLALCQETALTAFGRNRYRLKTWRRLTGGSYHIRLSFTAYARLSCFGTEALAALYKARQGHIVGETGRRRSLIKAGRARSCTGKTVLES